MKVLATGIHIDDIGYGVGGITAQLSLLLQWMVSVPTRSARTNADRFSPCVTPATLLAGKFKWAGTRMYYPQTGLDR